ncbi:GH25 family lysozyme [Streptomyces sp. H49]|uniref:GH25 family lysozyme n=1 Tax=Streptomyces sp. H49 TaxID=3444117 RepID=UPI003F4AC401
MIRGIDISSYQPSTYPTSGLAFVVVKRTEGIGYVNPKAGAQVAHARAAGLIVGHYHYPHIANGAAKEADYFLAKLGSDLHAGDLLVLDWEWYGQAGITSGQADAFKDQWIARVKAKAPGHRVGLYADRNNWLHVDQNSNCGDFLWIADYVTAGKPRIQAKWTIHQYTDAAPQGGDGNVANFADKAAMAAWANPTAPKPPASKPRVSLAHVVAAAKKDPAAAQGHATYKAEVLLVEKALQAEKLLASEWVDGSFGTETLKAYAALQRKLGYTGKDADGIPGKASLTRLGDKHGFTVTS